MDTELVEGPVMTKVLKSKRIWQMLVFILQIFALQAPVFTEVDESKYVKFSAEVPPQFSVNVQQTPKPEAQLPALVPPLFEHSSAV